MTKHDSGLLTLPNEMLLMVAGCLTKYDQQCFALTCKYLKDVICQGKANVIDGPVQNPYSSVDETKEFFLRLQKDWVPKDLKWCHHCGKFQSRDKAFWDEVGNKYTNKAGGEMNQAWVYLLKKGKYSALVSEWCDQKALRKNSAIRNCPRCIVAMGRMRSWGWEVKGL